MPAPRITLLSRPGCHLCDDARAVIRRVADDLGVGWEERDITQSEADLREYWDKIPVTFVDGVQHDFWRVSEDRLRAAIARDSARRLRPSGNVRHARTRPCGAVRRWWKPHSAGPAGRVRLLSSGAWSVVRRATLALGPAGVARARVGGDFVHRFTNNVW